MEFGDQRQLLRSGLDRILRVIVDRAERLIGQVSGAEVVHQRRIQRRRVECRGDSAQQDDARSRRILRDPDVGRERTDDTDRGVLGDARCARYAVVETIVEEQRITRTLEEKRPHIGGRERAGAPTVTGFTGPSVPTEGLFPKQPFVLVRLLSTR